MSSTTGSASILARFSNCLTADTIPGHVMDRLHQCALNGFAIGAGALGSPYHLAANLAAERMFSGHEGTSTIFGNGRRTSPVAAAFCNAVLLHGRTQEDTLGGTHIGCVALPVLLALAESGQGAPEDFYPALLTAYELAGPLDDQYGRESTARGNRSTCIFAPVAAAAAAARFIGMSDDEVAAAIDLAASFVGGVGQSFVDGTDDWRFQVGIGAVTAIIAAELARGGIQGAPNALEGSYGLLRAFSGERQKPSLGHLGNDWWIDHVAFKEFPVCAYNQAVCACVRTIGLKATHHDVASMSIRMNDFEAALPGVASFGPFGTMTQAIMSAPLAAALTMVEGAPSLHALQSGGTEAAIQFMKQIEFVPDPGMQRLTSQVTVVLRNGNVLTQRVSTNERSFALSDVLRDVLHESGCSADLLDRLHNALSAAHVDFEEICGFFEAARNLHEDVRL